MVKENWLFCSHSYIKGCFSVHLREEENKMLKYSEVMIFMLKFYSLKSSEPSAFSGKSARLLSSWMLEVGEPFVLKGHRLNETHALKQIIHILSAVSLTEG